MPTDWLEETILRTSNLPGTHLTRSQVDRLGHWADVSMNADRLGRAIQAGVKIAFRSDIFYACPRKTRGEASMEVLARIWVGRNAVPRGDS